MNTAERSRSKREAVAEAAERQMRRWLLMEQIDERRQHECSLEDMANRLGPYIAISRESGCGGAYIARLVGAKLRWEVLDKELLDFMAERYGLPRDLLEFVDETTSNWLHESFGIWLDRRLVSQDEYVDHLGKIVLMAARHGKVVLVGRGAQFLLPRHGGLAVRIIAPPRYRIEQIMQRRGLSRQKAERFTEESDRGRSGFVRQYFNQDVTNPNLYDIVLNVEQFGPEVVAKLIVEAFEEWANEHEQEKPLEEVCTQCAN